MILIEGIENAVTAMEVYYNDFAGLGKSTIVLGGGLVGCEAAADYIDHGVETAIVEMKGALMPETTGLYRTAVHDFIDKNGGKYEVNAKVIKVGKDVVVAEQNGTEITIKADSVVNAMGDAAHMRQKHLRRQSKKLVFRYGRSVTVSVPVRLVMR